MAAELKEKNALNAELRGQLRAARDEIDELRRRLEEEEARRRQAEEAARLAEEEAAAMRSYCAELEERANAAEQALAAATGLPPPPPIKKSKTVSTSSQTDAPKPQTVEVEQPVSPAPGYKPKANRLKLSGDGKASVPLKKCVNLMTDVYSMRMARVVNTNEGLEPSACHQPLALTPRIERAEPIIC